MAEHAWRGLALAGLRPRAEVGSLIPMDVLEALLEGPRARGAFLLRCLLEPPWSLRIEDEAPLAVLAVLRGELWLRPDGGTPYAMTAGQVAIVPGPAHYIAADHPDTAPTVVIGPGGQCTDAKDGRGLWDEWSLGVRTWGNDVGSNCDLLVGTYEGQGEVSRPLLAALPVPVVTTPDTPVNPLVAVLAAEMQVEAPGQRVLLDRLLDALLISTLRTWFADQASAAPGWFRAQYDPVVGPALSLLHDDVAHPWTVDELATRVGVSRAALGRRFAALLGQPPIAYLSAWRLALAADLLASSDATVASIARQVGYGTPFSFSGAFKRAHGASPQQYRAQAEATPRAM